MFVDSKRQVFAVLVENDPIYILFCKNSVADQDAKRGRRVRHWWSRDDIVGLQNELIPEAKPCFSEPRDDSTGEMCWQGKDSELIGPTGTSFTSGIRLSALTGV
jgi:hypothetical protein